jgi:hypothetical protein
MTGTQVVARFPAREHRRGTVTFGAGRYNAGPCSAIPAGPRHAVRYPRP